MGWAWVGRGLGGLVKIAWLGWVGLVSVGLVVLVLRFDTGFVVCFQGKCNFSVIV